MCVCVMVCVCVCDSVPTLSPHTAHCPATASEGWSGRCRPYFGAVGGWRRSRNAPPLPMPGETDIQKHARERERGENEGQKRGGRRVEGGWRRVAGGGWRGAINKGARQQAGAVFTSLLQPCRTRAHNARSPLHLRSDGRRPASTPVEEMKEASVHEQSMSCCSRWSCLY